VEPPTKRGRDEEKEREKGRATHLLFIVRCTAAFAVVGIHRHLVCSALVGWLLGLLGFLFLSAF
jgi:hypothetical protein